LAQSAAVDLQMSTLLSEQMLAKLNQALYEVQETVRENESLRGEKHHMKNEIG
jgi:hypothetical protein